MVNIWKTEEDEEYIPNKGKEMKTLGNRMRRDNRRISGSKNKVDRIIRNSKKQRTKMGMGNELKNQEMTGKKSFLCNAPPKECEAKKIYHFVPEVLLKKKMEKSL